MNEAKPVIVTTQHRGVFFGYLISDNAPEKVTLRDARCCLYWDTGLRGFLGLAESGPNESCRIGPKVPETTLCDITSVTACTTDAVAQWEKAPWK